MVHNKLEVFRGHRRIYFMRFDFLFAKYKQKIKEIFNEIGIDDKIIFKELDL